MKRIIAPALGMLLAFQVSSTPIDTVSAADVSLSASLPAAHEIYDGNAACDQGNAPDNSGDAAYDPGKIAVDPAAQNFPVDQVGPKETGPRKDYLEDFVEQEIKGMIPSGMETGSKAMDTLAENIGRILNGLDPAGHAPASDVAEQKVDPGNAAVPDQAVSLKAVPDATQQKHTAKPAAFDSVPILMYHEIGNPERGEYGKRYTVTPEMFRSQLDFLHKKGFAPVSLDEYLSDDFSSLAPGKKPMMITFDDATAGQFRYGFDQDGLCIDRSCAVAIMESFAAEHKDFSAKAVFFVDFVDKKGYFQVPFAQKGLEKNKVEYLRKKGFDVQCHTLLHPSLKKEPYKGCVNNVRLYEYLMDSIGVPKSRTLAYPFGDLPQDKSVVKYLHEQFEYCFAAYGNRSGNRAPRTSSKRFMPYQIPRIEINGDLKNIKAYVIR